ncbi:MAG: ABC transporter substrate-binding protein [Acetobacteraceae bacterium]
MRRRSLLKAAAGGLFVAAAPYVIRRAEGGVTDTEIRIGSTAAYSGPASAYGAIGRAHTATWQWFNDQGGVNGRKVKFLSYDDAYSPPKAIEQVRRLVEQDEVACLCNTLGTAANTSFLKYVNQKKVPHLFVGSGADKFQDPVAWPWTIGWQPSYRVEAQILAKYALKEKPDGRIGILYQNDDFGKDYLTGFKDVLGDRYDKLVSAASYEVTDATIDSQLITMQQANVSSVLLAATPKFAAQAIRKIADMKWNTLTLLSNVSSSVGAVIEPAGADKAVGVISNQYYKDPTDQQWKNDPGMVLWREIMTKYIPGVDLNDAFYVYGFGAVMTMIPVLKQCGNDFSRENLMKQATNLKNVEVPALLPGIRVNTSPTNYHTISQIQLMRWTGKTWDLFGNVLSAGGAG